MELFTEKRRKNSNCNFSVWALRVGGKGRKIGLPSTLQRVLQNDAAMDSIWRVATKRGGV